MKQHKISTREEPHPLPSQSPISQSLMTDLLADHAMRLLIPQLDNRVSRGDVKWESQHFKNGEVKQILVIIFTINMINQLQVEPVQLYEPTDSRNQGIHGQLYLTNYRLVFRVI